MTADLTSVKAKLTPRNVSRLRNGHIVQLTAGHFGSGVDAHTHIIKVSGVNAKKVTSAEKKKSGVKVKLTPQEIEASGLRDTFKKIGASYRKNVRPIVGPALKQGISAAIRGALPAAAIAIGQPELAPAAALVANTIADPAAAALGRATGAYGLKPHGGKWKPPHLRPGLPLPDHSISGAMRRTMATSGGSFRPA